MRADLLALTDRDLEGLSNRGTVRRAARELERGKATAELTDEDGSITATWSDGVVCTIPAGVALADARCTCAAVGVCRHLVRTVMALRSSAPEEEPEPWDPGAISDEVLAPHFRRGGLARARSAFEAGCLVELIRSHKPQARFHSPPAALTFSVPGDPRYTRCSCDEEAPCRHVPMAVWAFRLLPEGEVSGRIEVAAEDADALGSLLDEVEAALADVAELGLAGTSRGLADRLQQLAVRARAAGLAWPAEILEELLLEWSRHAEGDARFSPEGTALLAGELLIRLDAIRNAPEGVPRAWVRGSRDDREMKLSGARFVGLGTEATVRRGLVELRAWLQDLGTGELAALSRRFRDPDDPEVAPPAFARLARRQLTAGVPGLAAIGGGQMLTKGGRLRPSRRMRLGRTRVSVSPSRHDWSDLATAGFAQVREQLRGLLPAALRPRRVGADFFVVAISAVEDAGFDPLEQALRATLTDARGDTCALFHPFEARAAAGFEALIRRLEAAPTWVSGRFRLDGEQLLLAPVGLVWEGDLLQPWVDAPEEVRADDEELQPGRPADEVVRALRDELLTASADLLTGGLARCDYLSARDWSDLALRAEELGADLLLRPIRALADELDGKQRRPRWQPTDATRALFDLLLLSELAKDMGSDPYT